MQEKLFNYGFDNWQITKLLKSKKLNTSHGVYKIKENILILECAGSKKEIKL